MSGCDDPISHRRDAESSGQPVTGQLRPSEELSDGAIVVRRWRVEDASNLHRVISANVEHLRPWMPFIGAEPLVVADRVALLENWQVGWDEGREFPYAITQLDGRLLGSCGLHPRVGDDGLEIGYWLSSEATGRGVATAATGLLVAEAFSLGHVRFVEIRHDRDNEASGRVAERAGFERVGEEPRAPSAPGESGTTVVWRLTRPD